MRNAWPSTAPHPNPLPGGEREQKFLFRTRKQKFLFRTREQKFLYRTREQKFLFRTRERDSLSRLRERAGVRVAFLARHTSKAAN
jgi:hypothetical protein